MTFSEQYVQEATQILGMLSLQAIEDMAKVLREVRDRGGRLFIVGSGGGAGHASHAVNDFRKIANIESYTPTDNVSELTARINDDGWETSYANWLRTSRLDRADALLVLSVGGGDPVLNVSLNLVRCIELAREVGAMVLGIVGRDGGFTARMADHAVIVPIVNPATVTPHTETFQALVWHLLVSHPRLQANPMKWESMR